MFDQMDHVADVQKNGGAELQRLNKLYEFPDFVKAAAPERVFAKTTLASTCADPLRLQFPCHTKASTWLSYLFFKEKAASYAPDQRKIIEKRFEKHAKFWALGAEFQAIDARREELTKTAEEILTDDDYAYVWQGENGHTERRLRLKSAADVKAAADYLQQYRDRFSYLDRRAMAERILTKAAAFGAAIGESRDFLERQAGRGVCDPAEVIALVRSRAALLPDENIKVAEKGPEVNLRQQFLKIADTITKLPRIAFTPASLLKLAETLNQLDQMQGLDKQYAHGLQRPEDVIFAATFTKTAQATSEITATAAGHVFEKEALASLNPLDVESLFGTDFLRRVSNPLGDINPEKMAMESQQMSRTDAELLATLLSNAGTFPLARKAASARIGLSPAEQEAWAEAFDTMAERV